MHVRQSHSSASLRVTRAALLSAAAALALTLVGALPSAAQDFAAVEAPTSGPTAGLGDISGSIPGEQSRAAAPQPARTILVKAMGQGATPAEAEAAAIKHARNLAGKHLERLGGELALFPGGEGQRLVSVRQFPVMGMAQPRALVLLELRLRGQAEPLPAESGLPVLTAIVGKGAVQLTASRPCEAVAALDAGPGMEPELLPGAVQVLRLAPGKTATLSLPPVRGCTLRALACTGGLNIPANPASVDEAFTRARTGHAHPALTQGVVSDCVELRLGRLQEPPAHNK